MHCKYVCQKIETNVIRVKGDWVRTREDKGIGNPIDVSGNYSNFQVWTVSSNFSNQDLVITPQIMLAC
jgi:hypothetical protein